MSGTEQRMNLRWAPPGPVAARFFHSDAEITILNGPIGSGKTTASIIKLARRAALQVPSPILRDHAPGSSELWPVRLRRTAVVRDTYRQLWRSTMPSWFSRFPKAVGDFTGAENAPARHVITFALPDRTLARWEVDFLAIGDQAVEDVLRGYEPSDFYLNEMDLLAQEVFTYAAGRYGRYPSAEHGGCTAGGIVADCNAPELESWLYAKAFLATPDELAAMGIALFRQPGGLEAGAENLANLPGGRGYYERQVKVNPDWYVQRMVHNKPGYSRAGKPIYGDDYNDMLHVASADLPGSAHLPLHVGLDAGGHPAAVFCQRMPSGQWHVLDELCGDHQTGAARFGQMLAQRLHERFRGWPAVGTCDPSALYGADRKAGEKDWSEIVAAQADIPVRPAPTNIPIARWEAVRAPLKRLIDGKPGFLLSPRCRVLRSGFNNAYHFKAIAGATGRWSPEANKNDPSSHVHDALQYALSTGGEDTAIRERRGEERRRFATLPRQQPAWSPYA